MTVVRELARIVANKIRKFNPEVVMGLPTGGLVLAPFVAEELGFGRLIISFMLSFTCQPAPLFRHAYLKS